jgi:hypothetical protein
MHCQDFQEQAGHAILVEWVEDDGIKGQKVTRVQALAVFRE